MTNVYIITTIATMRESYYITASNKDEAVLKFEDGKVTEPFMSDNIDAEVESIRQVQ